MGIAAEEEIIILHHVQGGIETQMKALHDFFLDQLVGNETVKAFVVSILFGREC